MIRRITIHDDEQGDFAYERAASEPFKWTPHWPSGNKSTLETDGRDVLWQIAIAVLQGIET